MTHSSSNAPAGPVPDLDHAADEAEYCPVSIGAKLIGDRWSLLILRELMVGARRFNEIGRGLPGLSRSLLSGRLRALEQQGLVQPTVGATPGYELTPAGEATRPVIMELGRWTVRWRFPPPSAGETNSSQLLWRLYQGVDRAALPPRRVTIELEFPGSDPRRGWLQFDAPDVAMCLEPPPQRWDLRVTGTVASWLSVWFGHRNLGRAIAAGDLAVEGTAALAAQFPFWFSLSPFAPQVAARDEERPDPAHPGP